MCTLRIPANHRFSPGASLLAESEQPITALRVVHSITFTARRSGSLTPGLP